MCKQVWQVFGEWYAVTWGDLYNNVKYYSWETIRVHIPSQGDLPHHGFPGQPGFGLDQVHGHVKVSSNCASDTANTFEKCLVSTVGVFAIQHAFYNISRRKQLFVRYSAFSARDDAVVKTTSSYPGDLAFRHVEWASEAVGHAANCVHYQLLLIVYNYKTH